MPTTPTPAPAAPVTAPAPATPTLATLSPTRRRTTRPAPPARVVYTRHATAGEDDDRIVNPAWYKFLKIMLVIGGVLFFLVFGAVMFTFGVMGAYRSHPSTQVTPQAAGQFAPVPAAPSPAPVARPTPVQPPTSVWSSRWSSREECEYHYKVMLHEAPAGRCD